MRIQKYYCYYISFLGQVLISYLLVIHDHQLLVHFWPRSLPDIYAHALRPVALGLGHIYIYINWYNYKILTS